MAVAAVIGGAVIVSNGLGERSASAIRSVAVLPIENLSRDSTHQIFADGMHDALITELARYPDLRVISRQSVLRYGEPGTKPPLPQIARELGADGIVEGTVLWEGGRVRMNAQLVHGPTDRHLWADSYQRDLRGALVLQAELAAAIAREVRVRTAPAQRAPRRVAGPPDSAPEELYLLALYRRGRQAELSRSLAGIATAKAAYRRAIEGDSTFALGYAGLAAVYGFEADYDYASVPAALDSARMMARRGVELDSTLPETRTALAVTLGYARQFEAAEREFRRAIDLAPSNAGAHFWYSVLLVALGRGEQALEEVRRAEQLDPFAPRGVAAMRYYATWLVTGERPNFKLPVRERRPILKLEPGEPWARAREAVELAQEGRCAEARAELQLGQQGVQPANIRMLPHAGEVYWRCGERDRARAMLEQAKRRSDVRDHGFRIAWMYTVMGQKDSAFAWLEHHRWSLAELSNLSAGWALDALRPDPRYPQLMRRLGIRKATQN